MSEMAKAFPEALVVVPEEQIQAMRNDLKDRHVAACAVCAPAQVIVTFNRASQGQTASTLPDRQVMAFRQMAS